MIDAAVDIAEKPSLFTERWSPKVVARLNDYEVKVVKLEGEFVCTPTTTPTSCSSQLTAS